ncbi:hypothetical protein [Hymenobacter cavernae]|uniref:Uncharacterized protein n=1 Tax=Hymenobacter cavernae TaxID=2044852 RepID=A0ABQ1UU25_9BACT|nr:hypothetical protein [Hymenobacter cavernae]GGF27121.1 hypothetical protein GCM10011383_43410 [Hymenobacter cavernae]
MRTFLIILVTAIFLYSPYGPSWGRDVVNMTIVLAIFGTIGKNMPRRRYHHDHD